MRESKKNVPKKVTDFLRRKVCEKLLRELGEGNGGNSKIFCWFDPCCLNLFTCYSYHIAGRHSFNQSLVHSCLLLDGMNHKTGLGCPSLSFLFHFLCHSFFPSSVRGKEERIEGGGPEMDWGKRRVCEEWQSPITFFMLKRGILLELKAPIQFPSFSTLLILYCIHFVNQVNSNK